ncbi:N-acetylmuramoyl-L-alanine amidase [candidate division KSB1 bacterium]|nr:N-acetylmuramoyl-L-alanine amidase [candidate division KSB1 bacterium]
MIQNCTQMKNLLKLFAVTIFITGSSFAQTYVAVKPYKGDGIYTILKRYALPADRQSISEFKKLNAPLFTNQTGLQLGKYYKLPIKIVPYNGKNIQSTLSIDYEAAGRIQLYNESIVRARLKKSSYHTDKNLWVPEFILSSPTPKSSDQLSIFGDNSQKPELRNQLLKGIVFYLVSGHGGPDPGAIGKRGKYKLYEDEYAYDITLRLALNLLEYGARVYMIVQDPNDGIRSDQILEGDRDEYYYGGIKISQDRKTRLDQRVQIINKLYEVNNKAKDQFMIILHVDSSSKSKRIDIFYYFLKDSVRGKALARTLYEVIDRKYSSKQPGRGYTGVYKSRNLHVLTNSRPVGVYIELGNIKNPKDQDRFIIENNRQAVANWLCDGLLEYCQEN